MASTEEDVKHQGRASRLRSIVDQLARQRRMAGVVVPWAWAIAAFLLRLPFIGKYPTEWDSVQLVMGLDRFDVNIGSPHAPGYWLYVVAGRLVRFATPLDAAHSMVILAAMATAAAVGVIYLIGRDLGGWVTGAMAAGLLTLSPHMWFYGAVVGSYAFDALACSLLVLLGIRARPGSRHGIAAVVVLALATGFRQSAIVLIAPLAAVAVFRSRPTARRAFATAATLAAALAIWVVPMALEQPGGIAALRARSQNLWNGSVGQTSVFFDGPPERVHQNMVEASGQTLAALAPLGPVGIAGLCLAAISSARRRRRDPGARPGDRPARPETKAQGATALVCLAMAILPGFGFSYLFFFGKPGYILSYLPAAVLLFLWPAIHLSRRGRLTLVAGVLIVGMAAAGGAFGAQRFLYGDGILPKRLVDGSLAITQAEFGAPYRVTRNLIRATDDDVDRYLELSRVLDPRFDVIVFTSANGGHRLRHTMWTMRSFWVAVLDGNRRILSARNLAWDWEGEADHVGVPPGGRAVFILDAVPPEMNNLVQAGWAAPLHLSTGPTVWVLRPGASLNGVSVREVPPDQITKRPLP